MNAMAIETECMDPADYWRIHHQAWHVSGDMMHTCHLPAHSQFYHELEQAAEYVLDQFGVSLN